MDIDIEEGGIQPSKKITHTEQKFRGGGEVPLGGADGAATPPAGGSSPEPVRDKTIRAFEKAVSHTEKWKRQPNINGEGASHVRTFHAKLTADAMVYMDQVINEWLDEHPEYEVKMVTSTVGEVTGKLKEPHLICQVWV